MSNLQKLEKHIAERVEGITPLRTTLEDVLIAIKDTIPYEEMEIENESLTKRWSIVEKLIPKWKLGKPLSKQSQQTINFLLEIFENE